METAVWAVRGGIHEESLTILRCVLEGQGSAGAFSDNRGAVRYFFFLPSFSLANLTLKTASSDTIHVGSNACLAQVFLRFHSVQPTFTRKWSSKEAPSLPYSAGSLSWGQHALELVLPHHTWPAAITRTSTTLPLNHLEYSCLVEERWGPSPTHQHTHKGCSQTSSAQQCTNGSHSWFLQSARLMAMAVPASPQEVTRSPHRDYIWSTWFGWLGGISLLDLTWCLLPKARRYSHLIYSKKTKGQTTWGNKELRSKQNKTPEKKS